MRQRPVKVGIVGAAVCAVMAFAVPALAQPVDLPIPPATTTVYPPGVKVIQTPSGPVYADRRGHTLYGMDMRTLTRWNIDPSKYCTADCAKLWEPLLAPANSSANIEFPRNRGDELHPAKGGYFQPLKAPDWTIIESAAGLQWVYKGWLVAFTRKGDKPGSTAFDGAEEMTWNTLKFVPPVPQIVAPDTVSTLFVKGAYALASKDGRLLFTANCAKACSGWTPLRGGMASHGIGAWTISNAGEQPQWHYRGKPVFVSQDDDPANVPAGAALLRP